jgi:hypothetical protein
MHVAHLLLVEAESHEEAKDRVESALVYSEDNYAQWSDWREVGGRWSDFFGSGKHILRYTENSKLAEEKIQEYLKTRKDEMLRMYDEVKNLDLAEQVANYDPEMPSTFDENSMKVYRLKKVLETLNDSWCPDSYVYDLEQHTTQLKYFRERLAIAPEMQYLVVMDFHF